MSDKLTRVDYFAERAKIGEIIAEIRLDKRMTQDELAERSGLSRSSLIAIEKGRANLQWILLQILQMLQIFLWS